MKLIALRCPECNDALAPENDHVVVACDACHAAILVDEEGLRSLPVRYVRPREGAEVSRWLPFWVYHGRVQMEKRRSDWGGVPSLEASKRLWGEPRTLYVPAWEVPLRMAIDMAKDMIADQPSFPTTAEPPEIPLTPAALTTGDALKMLDLIVVGIEAAREDWLADIEFELDVGEPVLWAFPADSARVVAMREEPGPVAGPGRPEPY